MKKLQTFRKAPEDMTREELLEALKLSRSTQWELAETLRKQEAEIKRLRAQQEQA